MKVTIDLNDPVDVTNGVNLLTSLQSAITGAQPATQAAPPPVTQAAPPPVTQAAPPPPPVTQAAPTPNGYDHAAHAERVLAAARDLGPDAKLLGPHMQTLGLRAISDGTQEQLGQLEVIIGQISAGA